MAQRRSAFSLLEVIIAVGIFAVGVAGILGLLGSMTRQQSANTDALVAQGLPDALRVELRRVRMAAGSLDTLAENVPVMTAAMADGLQFVATRDGGRLHSATYNTPSANPIATGERYFLVEVWRFDRAPLSYTSGDYSLAMHVRVSWPHAASAGGQLVPMTARESLTFNLALER